MARRDGEAGTPFQRSLGIRWLPLTEGEHAVTVEMDIRPDLCGPAGTLEAGVVSTLIDVAGASAAAMAAGGTLVATQSISTSFVASGRVGPVRATGTVVRLGSSDAVSEVTVSDTGRGSSADGCGAGDFAGAGTPRLLAVKLSRPAERAIGDVVGPLLNA